MDSDEFEEEMAAELEKRVQKARDDAAPTAGSSSGSRQQYESIYFDSDEEDSGATAPKTLLSNDDLLYDPDQDEEDQSYMDRIRENYVPVASEAIRQRQQQQQQPTKMPKSDAVLNCPACFVVICIDCQRHDLYQNQYRAMFAMNCSVDKTQKLKFPERQKGGKGKKNRNKKNPEPNVEGDRGEDFHPVKCEQCSTEVGVYDQEEVFHFFNIIPSHS